MAFYNYGVKFKSAGRTRYVRAEQIDHVMSRQAVVQPLPGSYTTGLPLIFAIDLGSLTQDIVIRGSVKDNDVSGHATWRDLRFMVIRAWKDFSMDAESVWSPSNPSRVVYTEPDGQLWTYSCLPTKLELTRAGGEAKWNFVLTLAVVAWPPVPWEA